MIRTVGKDDIRECVNVIRESFRTVAEEFGFTEENAPRFTAFAVTEDRLFCQLENEHRQMAAFCLEDGTIAGFYSLLPSDCGTCELSNLCVLPSFRHQGIGTELFNDAYERAVAAGCGKLKIGIVEENRILREWYEKNGFVHTGTKKFDFFPFTCGYMEKDL
jgi:ribosomal protein S18 acetylase RimI-like enzyme